MIPAESLRVYDTVYEKRRYGRPHDGGYVLAHSTPNYPSWSYDCFLSGGIADENSFELAILEAYPHVTCYAFDPFGGPGREHPRYHYYRQPVGYMGLDQARNALVKLDIERDEWPWLEQLEYSQQERIAQLVMELHSPHVPESRWSWPMLARLAQTHVVIHAHGNNWDGIVEAGGTRMPGTLEVTWLRRDLAGPVTRSREPIPSALDMPNDPSKPDHVVDWEPFIEVVG